MDQEKMGEKTLATRYKEGAEREIEQEIRENPEKLLKSLLLGIISLPFKVKEMPPSALRFKLFSLPTSTVVSFAPEPKVLATKLLVSVVAML